MATVTVPAAVGIALVAEPLVTIGFGADWKALVPIVRWTALYTLCSSLTWPVQDALRAVGRPAVPLVLALVAVAGSSAALALGVFQDSGLQWLIGGLVVASMAQALIDLALSTRLLRVPAAGLVRALLPTTVATVAMVVATLAADAWLAGLGPALRLVALIATGAAAYVTVASLYDRSLPGEMQRLLRLGVPRLLGGAGDGA